MKFILQDIDKMQKNNETNNTPKEDNQCYYNIIFPSNKIQCDHCRREITKQTKILANDKDYCISCFSNAEPYPLSYNVINTLDFPLFEADWSAHEELLLFQGLERFGFGNWGQIQQLLGFSKSMEDIEHHYLTYYLQTPHFLPVANSLSRRNQHGKLIKSTQERKPKNLSKRQQQLLNSRKEQQIFQPSSEATFITNKNTDNPAEIVGFMPKRREFEVDFDNDAELLLAELQFNDDDTEQEKQMKFRIMDIYNEKLTERIRRKNFVIDRKLLDLKEQTRLDKTRTKEEKEVYNMMKVFARFNQPEDHEKLVQGIIKQKQIRQRLNELKDIKAKGYNTLSQFQAEVEDKRMRNEIIKNTKFSLADSKQIKTRKSKREALQAKQQKAINTLTSQQQQICERFGITDRQFLLIKQAMIRQTVKQGTISKQDTKNMFKIDRNIIDGVFEFLITKQQIQSHLQE